MIVRKEANGSLLMIGQTDHSRLVGQFAAHWGNESFAAPQPFDSVVRAAVYHDYGWLSYETNPTITQDGETPDFRQVGAKQLDSYQWCVDWMAGIDRYSGLIVSMHRTGLWRRRYGSIAYPTAFNPRALSDETEAFITKHEAWQEEQQRTLDPAQVWTNYRLLQVWDLLGLYFCCAEPTEDHIEPAPTSYAGGRADGVTLSLTPVAPRRVAVDPYPFNERPLGVQLTAKRLPEQRFADLASFQKAYFQAPTEILDFELVAA
ncbi:MAG TPA: DUF3891 family protein [Stellaceae bacterium]|nr:DUF3891 family protein [Stellaceae bacterium]